MQYTADELESMGYTDLVDVINDLVRSPDGAKGLLTMGPNVVIRSADVLRNLIADVDSQLTHRQPRHDTNPHSFASWRQKAVRYREALREHLRMFETVAREHYSASLFDFVLLVTERIDDGDLVAAGRILDEVRILPWNKTMREILDAQPEYEPAATAAS